ncbi:MAG: esterase/lipase family protein [Bacteroidota bacterium]
MRKIIIIALIGISATRAIAQPDDYRADLDYLFGLLDKTRLSTGYLGPYGIDAVDKDDFNGILADSNTVNSLDLFRFIYADLLTAKFNPVSISLPSIETLNQDIQNAHANSLAIFYANYNEFNEDAINQGLIIYVNGRLHDNLIIEGGQPESPPNPYINKKLLAVNPVKQYFKNTVTLRYNPALFYNNTSATVQNIWINFGNGYNLMTANTDISHTYTDSTGYHRIAIKLQMSNGDIAETYTAVMVEVTSGANRYTPADLSNPDFTIPASATQSGCRVYIRRSVNTPAGQILKPLLVVEGLDIHDVADRIAMTNYDVNDLIREWELILFNNNTVNFNFDDIGHYDLIFIDWNNGVDDIRRNALTLEQVIITVNTMKTGTEQNVILGISMGGLVARYALADMTKRGVNTQTRLLITHDSPHHGAYVPLAFQHLVTDLQNRTILGIRLGSVGQFIDQGVSLLNSPAAQQQLILTVADANGTIRQNDFLEAIYRPMVTFLPTDPQPQYQFIATSQGSQCGIGSNPVGVTLVNGEAQGSISGPLFILTAGIVSRFKIKTNLAAKGLQGNTQGNEILYFRWRRESSLFWGVVNTSKTFIDIHRFEPTNISTPIPWESVPGAVEGLRVTNQTIIAGGWNIISLNFFGFDFRFQFIDRFTFLPVISALDVANPGSFNSTNIFNFVANVTSPAGTFVPQRIIAQERFFGTTGFEFNQFHTDFTSRNARWIFNEMQNIPQPNTCEDQCTSTEIIGPDAFCNFKSYSVNLPAGATVNWTINPNPNHFVTAAANGNVLNLTQQPLIYQSLGNSGEITITANFTSGCGNGTLQKTVFVGNRPPIYTLMAPNGFCEGDPFEAIASAPYVFGLSYNWYINGNLNSYHGYKLVGNFGPGLNTYIGVQVVTPSCGTSDQYYQLWTCGGTAPVIQKFLVSPVPADDRISITGINGFTFNSARIVDKFGVIKKHWKSGEPVKSIVIDISDLPIDIYYIQLFENGKWIGKPIIIH